MEVFAREKDSHNAGNFTFHYFRVVCGFFNVLRGHFRLTVVCETKWDETKWKSVVCEMEICSLRNGNLYFAKWKSVVCEMRICSLRNENL